MGVSKALRFQVLRRDGHRCHYCGGSPPDVKLAVDHVLPVALGGTDTADNLITSCAECNAGKGAMPPDAATVAQVDRRNVEWAAALEQARAQADDQREARLRTCAAFIEEWDAWPFAFGGKPFPLPDNFPDAIETWVERGLTVDDFRELIVVTMGRDRLPARDRFRYFAGCCWRRITEIEKQAARIMDEQSNGG